MVSTKHKFNLHSVVDIAYAVVAFLFFAFIVYMFCFESNEVYRARGESAYRTVENYSEKKIDDPTAPIGVRKEYKWTLGEIENNENSLIFYTVHTYAEVRFDNELMYSLTPGKNNRIGGSPSSNWVVIPVYPSDSGRVVTVTLTPAYRSVLNRDITFQIGSRYSVFMNQLKADLPQIALSLLCILMGFVLIIMQLYHIVRRITGSWDLLYLGHFSLLMGIWRIADTRFSSVMFGNNTMAIGYVTLAALFMIPIPLLLFADNQHTSKRLVLLRPAALVTCAVSFGALICQVFGVAELREMLTVCHVMLIINIAVLILSSFMHIGKSMKDRNTLLFIILLVIGSVSDILNFYRKGSSAGMMLTLIAFLIFAFYRFTEDLLSINRKAYMDANTKLFNKTRWDEFLEYDIPDDEPIGIMMLDLNRLKHTNDTMGHRIGDKMIANFAKILRNSFDSREFLCRWGGDEFTVIIRNANHEKLEHYDSVIHAAVDAYNQSGEQPEISFACGYVLSTDFPGLSRKKLLAKADRCMYLDKQKWYEQHLITK